MTAPSVAARLLTLEERLRAYECPTAIPEGHFMGTVACDGERLEWADELAAVRTEVRMVSEIIEANSRCMPKGHMARVEHIHNEVCDCGILARLAGAPEDSDGR